MSVGMAMQYATNCGTGAKPHLPVPEIDLSTAQKGELAVLRVMQRAVEKDWIASRPTRDCRYDLILDDSQRLYRVQVKYCGRLAPHAEGAVLLDFTKGGLRTRTYLHTEIDAVVVYVSPADLVVWLGPERFHDRRYHSIRYVPTRNGQQVGVLLASDIAW